MLTQNKTLALLLTTFTVAALSQGCGSDAVKPKDAGTDASAGGGGSSGTGGGSGQGGSGQGGAGTSGQGGAGTSGQGGAGTSGQDGGGTAGMNAAGSDGGVDAPLDIPAAKPDGSQGISWLFDTTVEGWHFTKYGSTPDANAANNLALTSTLAWDGTNDADDKTTSGSLKGTVPFTAFGDRIDFQAFTVAAPMYDWTGYTISAKVKLVSGGNVNPGCPLTAWLYVSQSPDYNTSLAIAANLSKGNWVTLTYDVSTANINIAAINQMGIQITTGASCTAAAPDAGTDAATDASAADGGVADAGTADGGVADAGVDAGPPATATTAVILIDDVIVSVK